MPSVSISASDKHGKLTANVTVARCKWTMELSQRQRELRTRRLARELVETAALKKKYPEYSHLSAAQLKGFGDYSGDWYGVAYCDREPVNMEMHITSQGRNQFRSRTVIERSSGKFRSTTRTTELIRPPKRSGGYDPYDIVDFETGKTPKSPAPLYRIDEVFKVNDRPQYIKVSVAGKCRNGYLARFDSPATLSGAYSSWKTMTERCGGFTKWMKRQRSATLRRLQAARGIPRTAPDRKSRPRKGNIHLHRQSV